MEKIGWKRIFNTEKLEIPKDAMIVSLIFENKNWIQTKNWALNNGFFIEETSDQTIGLRYEVDGKISWVQYFGPDSHAKTRQAPFSELLFTVKLPKKYYAKVGFNGILHLAHASIEHLNIKALHSIWKACFKRTKKILNHSPDIKSAAKTTHLK